MTAALAAPLPSSRRVSAGITAAAGSTSRAPAWWSADDYVADVRQAVKHEHRDVCRQHHVEPDTVVSVARAMAAHADFRTGRDCRPTNARLVELLGCSLSTVQRARRVMKALGLCRELVAGRTFMTRAERIAAWRRGSSHRQVAAVFALTSRRARGAKVGPTSVTFQDHCVSARPTAVERDTPPGAHVVSLEGHLGRTHLRATTEQRGGGSAPAHTEGSHRREAGRRLDPAARRLAEGVRFRLSWLRGVHVRRLVPTLTRFARAGWTVRDVERAAAESLAALGWRVPRDLRTPAPYLARLLRDVDPADRPGALDEQRAAAERAQRAYERRLIHGAPCPHGQPAGDEPSPLRGHLACPACRASAAASAWPTVRVPGAPAEPDDA